MMLSKYFPSICILIAFGFCSLKVGAVAILNFRKAKMDNKS